MTYEEIESHLYKKVFAIYDPRRYYIAGNSNAYDTIAKEVRIGHVAKFPLQPNVIALFCTMANYVILTHQGEAPAQYRYYARYPQPTEISDVDSVDFTRLVGQNVTIRHFVKYHSTVSGYEEELEVSIIRNNAKSIKVRVTSTGEMHTLKKDTIIGIIQPAAPITTDEFFDAILE